MAEQLTPSQKLAVENRGGKLLVSAAAGSGKTKVLVDRLMHYLTDKKDPANLDDFLIITYTKAAASELRGKISDKLTRYIADNPENRHMQQQIQRLHMAKICTVHSFCADILREHAYLLDLPADFRIAEENECQEMMRAVLEKLLDEAYISKIDDSVFRAFIDSQGLGRDDRQVPEIILQIYSSALCHLDPVKWLDQCVAAGLLDNVTDAGKTVWGAYLIQDLKDFLDLQISTLENCIRLAGGVPGFEKPISVFSGTVSDLKQLQQCEAWDQIVNYPGVSYGVLTFKKEHRGSDLAEQMKAVRNHCKDGLHKKLRAFRSNSTVVLEQLRQTSVSAQGIVALVKEFYGQYDALKHARRVLDFSDIEQKTLDLLLGKTRTSLTAAAREISLRYREILVDEYQDSNAVQDAIFGALTTERNNCFMVGDVKQSIYQFRLADPSIFLQKYNTYVPAENAKPTEGRKVMLSSNFRSSGGVIAAVNDVFSSCMSPRVGGLYYGDEEMLYEGIPHIPLTEPEVELYGIDVREDTYQEEARFVASRILELLDGKHCVRDADKLRPITPKDIVILLRSPGSVGGEFFYALEEAGIPCTMGTGDDLLQKPHVEALCAMLEVIHNPLQDIPLISALTSPVFGFTANDLARIRIGRRHLDFYHALSADKNDKTVAFLDTLHTLREDARFLTVTQLIQKIYLHTNMLCIYGAMQEGENIVADLHAFSQIVSAFESTGRRDLFHFLEYLHTMRQQGISVDQSVGGNAVQIMSIHKSKGLEFPVVFLCGLSRSFNMSDTTKAVLCHKELGLGLACTNQAQRVRFPTISKRAIAMKIAKETVSEELRVLYVAMTRPRDRLIMTFAAQKLEDRLRDIQLRMDLSNDILLTAHVNCPGNWILLTALKRTEAGEFFRLAGYPSTTAVHDHPWLIRIVQAPELAAGKREYAEEDNPLTPDVISRIRSGLAFQYPYMPVVSTPSKLTATQLKGRVKDQEAAENTNPTPKSIQRIGDRGRIRGTDYGNAMHTLMQYINFAACNDFHGICDEIKRLVDRGLLKDRDAQILDAQSVADFFATDLGLRIRNGKEVLREFKFSVLEDAENYCAGTAGEKILLQGVIDCALIDNDEIIIVDFKTDAVTDDNVHLRAQEYTPQVRTYAGALARIYERSVSGAYLYFFRIRKLIRII